MFLLAQSSVPWHGKELNSLSHLDIFILMKTAINFATQTPTFTETQRSYLLPGVPIALQSLAKEEARAQRGKKGTHRGDVLIQ